MTAVAIEPLPTLSPAELRAGWPGSAHPAQGAPHPSVLDAGTTSRADLVRPLTHRGQAADRAQTPLPVPPALLPVLPNGLPRGQTISVTNSVSLVLALLGGVAAAGGWCAVVGLPTISAEAAREFDVDLSRLALIPAPGTGWLTAVGALLDAVDVVVVRPPDRASDGDRRRLGARARSRNAVLLPYLTGGQSWPRTDCTLLVRPGGWDGVGTGHGRLRSRTVTVQAQGRGAAGRPRRTTCWLPAPTGGISSTAEVRALDLDRRAG